MLVTKRGAPFRGYGLVDCDHAAFHVIGYLSSAYIRRGCDHHEISAYSHLN